MAILRTLNIGFPLNEARPMSFLKRNSKEKTIKMVKGSIPVWGKYTAGVAGQEFFQNLKSERLVASRSATTKKTYLPARLFDETNFERLKTEKVVPQEGTVATFTHIHLDMDGKRLHKPETIGFIKFKAIEGGLIHKITGPVNSLKIGAKVKAQFKKASERKGTILDIESFQLI